MILVRISLFLLMLPLAIALLLMSGCAARESVYRWGDYEDLIYEMYVEPGAADPNTQVEKLSADVERTLAEGKRVPPGVHAHLGYMYYMQGNLGAAANEFSIEKMLFPESSVFIDGILKRLHGKSK